MDDRLDIPIVTTADTSGAQQTSKAIEKLTDDTDAYQKALERMAKSQESVNEATAQAAQDAAMLDKATARRTQLAERKALEAQADKDIAESVHTVTKEEVEAATKTAEGTEKVLGKKKDLKEILHKLGEQFPVAAAAAKSFLNPLTAAVVLASIYIQKLSKDIENLHANIETSEWEGYGKVVEAQKKSFEDAALGAASFARQLHSVQVAAQSASDQAEKLMQIHKAQLSAQESVDEAQKRVDIERVKAGKNDPVREAQLLLEIEQKYATKKKGRADQEANFEISESKRKLANEEIAGHLIDGQIAKLEKRLETLKSESALTEQQRIEKENLGKTETELQTKQARVDELIKKGGPARIGLSSAQLAELGILESQIPDLDKLRGNKSAYVSRVEADRLPKLNELRSTSEELERLKSERLGVAARANGIRGTLPTQEALARIATGERNSLFNLDSQSRGIPVAAQNVETQQGKDILAASATADKLARGGSASGADQQFLVQLSSFINKREMTLGEAVKYMSKANDTIQNLNAEVARLNARLDGLQRSTINQIRR